METPRCVQAYPKSETLVEGRLAPYFYLRACEENQRWFSIAHLRISLITYSHMKVTSHWEVRICCKVTKKVAPWVCEGACFQAQWPEFDLQDQRGGRRELTPTHICMITCVYPHICSLKNKWMYVRKQAYFKREKEKRQGTRVSGDSRHVRLSVFTE